LNNGDDSHYYLEKGLTVVGIDANPRSCQECTIRFAREIAQGRMRIINVGIGASETTSTFYVNGTIDTLSTFRPERFDDKEWAPKSWEKISIDVVRLSTLISQFGDPYFIKLDIEYLDEAALIDLNNSRITPQFISAEAHDLAVHTTLLNMGYRKFKTVVGAEVNARFGETTIRRIDGTRISHSFPLGSSGPFGDDLPGPWLDSAAALTQLIQANFDWIDLQASL